MKIELKLYISGSNSISQQAKQNLNSLVAGRWAGEARVEIIDIQQQPAQAVAARITATPTLLKVAPEPCCKLIGDLSDQDQVLNALGLPSA